MIGHWTQSLLPQEAHTALSQLGNLNLQAQHHCANSIALLPKVALRAHAGERSREGGTLYLLSDLLDLSSRTFPKVEIVSLHFQLPSNKKSSGNFLIAGWPISSLKAIWSHWKIFHPSSLSWGMVCAPEIHLLFVISGPALNLCLWWNPAEISSTSESTSGKSGGKCFNRRLKSTLKIHIFLQF